jgi:phage shock protein PspC (stress-responsive transcriptional regulator)
MNDTSSEPRDEGVTEASEPSTPTEKIEVDNGTQTSTPTETIEVDDGTRPAPPSASPVRRLTRRMDGKVLGGVANGLAAYFAIDPLIVRLGFVAFVFVAGPIAVLLYLLAWAVIPADPHSGPAGTGRSPSIWLWVVIGIVALPILFSAFGLMFGGPWDGPPWFGDGDGAGPWLGFWRPGLFWALVLIAVGIVLFRRGEQARGEVSTGDTAALAAAGSAGAPVRSRTPSMLGRLTVAAALLVAGIVALIDNVGLVDIGFRAGLGLVLAVVGVGLLVGAFWGSARWLIAIGLLILPLLYAAGWAERFGPWGPDFRGGEFGEFEGAFPGDFQDRVVQPTSLAEISDPIRLDTGDLTLDLTRLPLSQTPAHVEAGIGAGNMQVLVPADAGVDVAARVGAGAVDVLGTERNGPDLTVTTSEAGPGGRLTLDLQAGFGEIVVEEVPPLPQEGI